MPASKENKDLIIAELENARTKGSRLVIALKFAGKNADADKAKQKVRTLGGQIDDLIAKAMKQWSITAQIFIDDMKATNKSLQADINDIKKKRDLANKTVKALGRLDEFIVKASEIIGKIR